MNPLLKTLMQGALKRGTLHVTWADGTKTTIGNGDGHEANLNFHTKAAEWAFLLNPELAVGEEFMGGELDFLPGRPIDFLLFVNDNWRGKRPTEWMEVLARLRYLKRRIVQNNNRFRARRNVAHHYDLDERLYRLFLDSDLQYSCAYFETPESDLEEAQWAKKRHIAAKLLLEPGLEVLDIGSGWGGLGLFMAERTGASVTGVTLSTEQHRVSNERARALGLAERAVFELKDYRLLDRQFDRIVSVGMFEHVGVGHYQEFFQTSAKLLKPEGVMLLHSIGRTDGPGSTNPWIEKYIFPGGYTPALSEVLPIIERSGLIVTDIEILRLHYAETLKAWRQRFMARRDEAAAIYDERFCRMWEFYLAGSEAAFRSGDLVVFQIQMSPKQDAVPLTRNYIEAAERAIEEAGNEGESIRLAGE
ncbi:SAM-dependent methyltransferase [Propylenella binzhouense]|uniref:Class I SAM-dependent methyltransferase n=1 Tax=Propylenella binzhouense TaxID=2555902 RepID=A0A964T4U6_9HYPH|nr:cyclopropane-fatty-acyl-phospholipid synthase family protein [Propylenella binzhouense]MYZ48420.1 class I SAM-dependent methyltransferase [Propylenella binzhouense]